MQQSCSYKSPLSSAGHLLSHEKDKSSVQLKTSKRTLQLLLNFHARTNSEQNPDVCDFQMPLQHVSQTLNSKSVCVCLLFFSQAPQPAAAVGVPLGSRLAWALPVSCSPSSALPTRLPLGPPAPSSRASRPRPDGEGHVGDPG